MEETKSGTRGDSSGNTAGGPIASGNNPATGGDTPNRGASGGPGNGNGNSRDSGTVASSSVSTGGAKPSASPSAGNPPVRRVDNGKRSVSSGIGSGASGGNRQGGGRDSRDAKRETEEEGRLVYGLEEEEGEPGAPKWVGIPKGKSDKAPPRKGKAGDVDEESVAELVSAAFEAPRWLMNAIIPLEKGHSWWSKSASEVAPISRPLTEIINGLSPKAKKLISGNMNYLLLVGGIAAVCAEPISMEVALREEINRLRAGNRGQRLAQTEPDSGLQQTRNPSPWNGKPSPKRPSGGLEASRAGFPEAVDAQDEGDFTV